MTWIWPDSDLEMTWIGSSFLKVITFTQFSNCGKFYIIESKYTDFLGTNRFSRKFFNLYTAKISTRKFLFLKTKSSFRLMKIVGTERDLETCQSAMHFRGILKNSFSRGIFQLLNWVSGTSFIFFRICLTEKFSQRIGSNTKVQITQNQQNWILEHRAQQIFN